MLNMVMQNKILICDILVVINSQDPIANKKLVNIENWTLNYIYCTVYIYVHIH